MRQKGHRLIDKAMERSHIISIALCALLTLMIFLLSIAIILYHTDYAISLWLLAILFEVAEQSSNEEKPSKCCRGKCSEE
jgi:hypothetical protein